MAEAEEYRAKHFHRLDEAAADGSFQSVVAAVIAEIKSEVRVLCYTPPG